ncbi:uncharacterized protein N7484_007674 [Penicillium longicatenatum]|uniref:uncharacterized protein n=1 Tax=Penicillium longicatenatum TaxID=1561947 RepID=UPI002547BD9C|nr:uncharacterized protein N7484_007674 [Penicillium longicatenatum]KAJ5639812.1 hypothetical protein N7484_007674 [Penicillium longicatenatum]
MATPALPSHPGPDHLVTVKVLFNDSNRRFKLPLRDLRAQVFPQKLRTLLGVPADVNVILERYSDSAGCYIHLDSDNQGVYKQLYRAGKAKSKLRIKASTVDSSAPAPTESSAELVNQNPTPPRHSYLDTVLSSPIPVGSTETLPANTASSPAPTAAFGESLSTGVYGIKELANTSEPHYRNFEMENDTLRFPVISHNSPSGMFCIDCNNCGRSIANEHFHCGICENGDYDLCPACVTNGALCRGEGHWLIKRSVENGIVTNSTTETIPPHPAQVQATKPLSSRPAQEPIAETVAPVPAPAPTPAYVSHKEVPAQEEKPMCNGCCRETDESNLVRCNECEDYDLCLRCLLRNKHGHHPAHSFSLGSDRNFCLKNLILSRCLPGRQFQHAAICDGCEKNIVGTRHKCLDCPDWDYCPDCIVNASQSHPRHRFAPVYEALAEQQAHDWEIHYGIFCDGPLCKDKPAQSYINGIRYKCAVCDDIDFCANCEALPTHTHNRTHPLVKFRTPVRTVTVSTVTDDRTLGDQAAAPAAPVYSPAQSQISHCTFETSEEKEPVVEQAPVEVDATKPEPPCSGELADFQAYFMRDTIADGTKLPPDTCFRQTWTLYNPGPNAWPVGSDVRFSGGDAMFNVDSDHPSGVESIHLAMKSNSLITPVEPGSTADFTVNLRSSQREGTAISYWRLKLPNGTPIGHRLWCDIQVQATAEPFMAGPVESHISTDDTEITGSRMIFPKLEKESPETSTHEAVNAVRPPPTISTASEGDILEDVESLTLDGTDTDAGFLTDEEYDVLDASDQEFLEAKQSLR